MKYRKASIWSTFDSEIPVSQPPNEIFGVCKGQKSSEMYGPITGQQGLGQKFGPPLSLKGVLGGQNRLKK